MDLDRLDEAVKCFENALVIKPDYAEGHKNLSFALLNNGRLIRLLIHMKKHFPLNQTMLRPITILGSP